MTLMEALRRGELEALWRLSIWANDRSVIAAAFLWLSKTTPTLGAKLADLVQILVDDVEPSQIATAEVRSEVCRQKWLVAVSKNFSNDARNGFAALWCRVEASNKRNVTILPNASAVLDQMVRTITQLRQLQATVLTMSKDLTDAALLKTFITGLKKDIVLYEVSEDRLRNEFARATGESSRIGGYLMLHVWLKCRRGSCK